MPARAANHLLHEASPYLQQHAHNPVDWYPWGEQALARARAEDKPIFLSVGYAACHWCHVMERESFENAEIASFLNEHFVSIKVDREERPDVDEIYMAAVQMLTGSGGWPMSVFLTPSLEPFFGGTYFPPDDRWGRPGFARILRAIEETWRTKRGQVTNSADQIATRIRSMSLSPGGSGLLTREHLVQGVHALSRSFDPEDGGFGAAPKFPHTMGLQLLFRHALVSGDLSFLRMATHTLDKMADGGIYDHLGGGFHRYSTDNRWLVPHFEKMLYDQSQLVLTYLEAFQLTGRARYATVARETLDYVARDLSDPRGGFYSSEDADSEGEEGRFYVWTPAEVESLLGPVEAPLFRRAYDVDAEGNFEGHSILHPIRDATELAREFGRAEDEVEASLLESRGRLFAARFSRERPFRDEKVVTAWNGLMIGAFARAARVLGNAEDARRAARAAELLTTELRPNGLLHRVWKDGQVRVPGFLEDYACVIFGLVELYQATFEARWLDLAVDLAGEMIRELADPEGGFFSTSERHDGLLTRLKSAQDGSTPSGNSMAAYALLELGHIADRQDLEKAAEGILRAFQGFLERSPSAFQQMLLALDLQFGPRQEIVIVGQHGDALAEAMLTAVNRKFLPRAVLTWTDGRHPLLPLHEGKSTLEGKSTVYVCENYVCAAPVNSLEGLARALEG